MEITIFEDPITEKKPEGKARLEKFLNSENGLELWTVYFPKDKFRTERWIASRTIKRRKAEIEAMKELNSFFSNI